MSNVINLHVERALRAKQGYLQGPARCHDCGATWQTLAPVGSVWLTCPECDGAKGQFVGPIKRDGEHLACRCGNDLFHMTPDGAYCTACGEWLE